MTASEAAKFLGRSGMLSIEGGKLGVVVECSDVRESFGRLDVLVEPVNGTGKTWVSEGRVAWAN